MAEPIRSCLGCKGRFPQSQLRRLALRKAPLGWAVVFDDARAIPGRGAWVCRDNQLCQERAFKPARLAGAFKIKDGPVRLMTG
ncbi:MAG: DUF448 domain-containing protein [Deltaproteobacteria bacterium]|nr:DUF448 domain-containing protein [Deltaproteobacteria bacterium]